MVEVLYPCEAQNRHAVHPTAYVAHGEWAEQMLLTHEQGRCPECDGLDVWTPKDPSVLAAPALIPGECAGCRAWYLAGTLIRSDDKGDWLAECCQYARSPR